MADAKNFETIRATAKKLSSRRTYIIQRYYKLVFILTRYSLLHMKTGHAILAEDNLFEEKAATALQAAAGAER